MTAPLGRRHHVVQDLRRLVRDPKRRGEQGVVVLEGVRAVTGAVEAGAELSQVVVEESAWSASGIDAAIADIEGPIALFTVVDGALESVLSPKSPQPVAAVASFAPADPDLVLAGDGPVLALAGVGDPGNVGAMIRTAVALDAAGVLVSEGSVDVRNPKVVRASAGALFAVPIADRVSLDQFAPLAAAAGRPLVVAHGEGGEPPAAIDLASALLVLGSEAHGVPAELRSAADATVTIPLTGAVESLNVAVTAGILLHEAKRPRAADVAR